MQLHSPLLFAALLIPVMLGCAAEVPQSRDQDEMTDTSEFIEWVEQLDADLDREFDSYNVNADGEITYIDLQEAQITDNDLSRLVGLKQLEELNICGNEISDEGLIHIAQLTTLQYLDLSFTHITDDGLQHLQRLTNLQSLLLNGLDDDDQLTDAGIRYLVPLVQLSELRLNGAHITDQSVDALLTFRNLRMLDISGTRISEEGYRRLREGLPDCDIERHSVT